MLFTELVFASEIGTGCGKLWYWTILMWEILLLDFLLWEILVLDYFAVG